VLILTLAVAEARTLVYPPFAPVLFAENWQHHCGTVWPRFAAAKKRYDPRGVLTPSAAIFVWSDQLSGGPQAEGDQLPSGPVLNNLEVQLADDSLNAVGIALREKIPEVIRGPDRSKLPRRRNVNDDRLVIA
jgi:cytokinin dehydrogenase 1-like protein